MSPARKRQAVDKVQKDLDVSQRRASQVIGQARSTQRYRPRRSDINRFLVDRMVKLSRRHPRYGYRRIWVLLRREGWLVNRKRVYRLWRREGLKVPKRRRKRRFGGSSQSSCIRRPAGSVNDVWCYDILKDRTADGRALRVLSIVDEYTRQCLGIEVGRSMKARQVQATLERLFVVRGRPRCLRSDNGSEFIERKLRRWLGDQGVEALYVAPGSPWENGYAESFHNTLREELLNREYFWSLRETQVLLRDYQMEYNHYRPHSSLGYQTPVAFAAAAAASDSATLRPSQPQPSQEWSSPTFSGT